MAITSLYASLLAFVFFALSFRVVKLRRQFKVAIGHGNHKELERAMRAHANFAEYTPFAVLLMAMLEQLTHLNLLIHALGLLYVAGRILHAYNISRIDEHIPLRVVGMSLTFIVIITAAIGNLLALLLQQLG